MEKKKNETRQPRDRVLAIKVTADEKKKLDEYAEKNSVNISAMVRKLLFNQLQLFDQKTSHR